MKRVHDPTEEHDVALTDDAGHDLIQVGLPECDNPRCRRRHYFVIPEDEMADRVVDIAHDVLRRLGLSGRVTA